MYIFSSFPSVNHPPHPTALTRETVAEEEKDDSLLNIYYRYKEDLIIILD